MFVFNIFHREESTVSEYAHTTSSVLWASPSSVLLSASLYYWTCMCAFTSLKSVRKRLFCWRHWHSAMDVLTQSYIFEQKLQHCKPIDLGRFVVDLRERHLEYWTIYSKIHLREHNSKHSISHPCCALPTKRALVTHSPYILPNTCFSTCLVMSPVVQLVLDFVFIPYVLRQRLESISPPMTCVMLMISKMSSMFFSTASIPT